MEPAQPLPPGEVDGAERAFEALRAEVAALRRGIELVFRQGQESGGAAAGPDYSLTLGQMQKALQAIGTRLDAIEQTPALAATPGQQTAELRRELQQAGEEARRGLGHSQAELDATVRELRGVMAAARERGEQRQWLWAVGIVGALAGMLLWFLATALLPWGGGTWLAGLAFGGRWNAGQALLQDASPASWERMLRLYNACPQDSRTELCEAAMAVRTISPGSSASERARETGTVPKSPRGAGQGR